MSNDTFIMRAAQVFSAGWVGVWLVYFFATFDDFSTLSANNLGDFFAGIFAPLAFAWLVAGFFQQAKEIRQGNEQLRLQAEELELQRIELAETRKTLEAQRVEMEEAAKQAKAQAEAVKQNADHAAKDTFFRVLERQDRELNGLLSAFFRNSRVAGLKFANIGALKETFFTEGWARVSHGDVFYFANQVLRFYGDDLELLLYVSEEQSKREHVSRFRRVFEKAIMESELVDDESRSLRSALEWSPFGEVYALFTSTDTKWFANFKCRSQKIVDEYRKQLTKDA